MPRLQILQHKSYHPYLEKNKQRVREDEARAAAEDAAREQKRVDNEAEARLDILRRRAGSPSFHPPGAADEGEEDNLPSTSSARDESLKTSNLLERRRKEKAREEKRERKKRDRLDFDFPVDQRGKGKERERPDGRSMYGQNEDSAVRDGGEGNGKWETGGHVNLFADLERNAKPQPSLAEIAKKKKDAESDPFTMYLSRPERETKPWYADRELKRVEDKETGDEAEERRARDKRKDARSKNRHDPLTQITSLLSTSSKTKSKPTQTYRQQSSSQTNHTQHSNGRNGNGTDPTSQRLSRESSERQRALALIAKSQAPARSWDMRTPSSVGGGGERSWAEDWERQKNVAGHRFFDAPSRTGGGGRRRSWEV